MINKKAFEVLILICGGSEARSNAEDSRSALRSYPLL
jgi:hypothetical protein